ncbi:MAG: hypothetical protein IPQ02_04015 [Saprospiraceae bacterium]|uniref:Uncharacterized protein n=1 Tax=Candidatus Defluviibacterium haderslevense TaxID=2981993 RepID=A0A9D7SCC7_9BACT|nr:hypothetical protein [Candidatus Defluviibacterium haderslevense]MBL0235787.1 hypothetical protein [Candidatus Defluviibacterium haderslevense]
MSTNSQVNSSNPFSESGSKLVLQVPKEIKVKLVNSSELINLKIWSILSSFFSNATVGFWVWYCQTENSNQQIIKVMAIVTTLFTLGFICVTLYYNYKLKEETSEIKYTPHN